VSVSVSVSVWWSARATYSMVVDSLWATVSMAVVITTRGKMPAPVAIAVYNQLEKLNMHVGNLLSVNDVCAQALPNYMKIQDFLVVTECRGKSCIEEDLRAAPVGWPGDGTVSMEDVVFHYASDAPSALSGVSISIKSGEKIGVCGSELPLTGAAALSALCRASVPRQGVDGPLIAAAGRPSQFCCPACVGTGAGKSTLLSILFSLGPLTEGEVQIAGHNLAEISCHEVRARLAIVPQSPTLFAGVSVLVVVSLPMCCCDGCFGHSIGASTSATA
jgi:ABC-type multidrug transport system fused ATPase/permease subunit